MTRPGDHPNDWGPNLPPATRAAAARGGDFEGLLRVLDPEVTWRTHTARGVIVRLGATEVAGRARNAHRARAAFASPILVNGEPGVVVYAANGRPLSVMACTVVGGRIVEILSMTDPERLAAMDVPGGASHAQRPAQNGGALG